MTTIADIIMEELPAFAERTGRKTLEVLEVGVLRERDVGHAEGDGHSTIAFAQLLKNMPGSRYTGIDLKVANAMDAVVAARLGAVCDFIQGDSVEMMETLLLGGCTFDVIYLDCDNSAKSTMAEYELALQLLKRPGLLLGDDMNVESDEVHKGKILIPYLIGKDIPFEIRQRSTPWDHRDVLIQYIP